MGSILLVALLLGGLVMGGSGDEDEGLDPDPIDDGLEEPGGGPQTLTGTEGDDTLEGGTGDDLLNGGRGDDNLTGGAGNDRISGERGDDLIYDTSGSDTAIGGSGDDILILRDEESGAPDVLSGGAGSDILWGDDGDHLTGGSDTDVFVVPFGPSGSEPVIISDLDFHRGSDGEEPDRVVFVTEEGEIIPRSAFFDGTYAVGIGDLSEGRGAGVYVGNQLVAVIEGQSAEDLFYETIWIGNFSPEVGDALGGEVPSEGGLGRDQLFGGSGDDTLTGRGGGDYLDGRDGDDVIDGIDAPAADAQGDTLVGNAGDDLLRGDSGDQMAGAAGDDSYEIQLASDLQDHEALRIHTYSLSAHEGAPELITLLDAEGQPLTAEEVAANLDVEDAEDGSGTTLIYSGIPIAVIEGITAAELGAPAGWLGNLEREAHTGASAPAFSGTEVTVISATSGDEALDEAFFGGNLVFSINSEDGLPTEQFTAAAEALDITHLRFPAGQGDSGNIEVDGESFLDILKMEQDTQGSWQLRPELQAMLDWAQDHDVKVTLVLPTKNYTMEEYEDLDDEIARFAETVLTSYGDTVEAFEIGNEYWSIGETEYGAKANIATLALAQGMQELGLAPDDQPAILVQMVTPNAGSEFHSSVDDRGFQARLRDANQTIIDQLSPEARAEIDGAVEHYYYNQDDLAFEGGSREVTNIDRDYSVWTETFGEDLDLHITEWNVRTTTTGETGLRAASVMTEMAARMADLGVDAAHVWPVQHNTTSDLAGRPSEEVVTDAEGRVLSTINGAMFDLMSSSLVGLTPVEMELEGGATEVNLTAWQSEDRTVIYVASRSLDVLDLELDLSVLVPEFSEASAVRISADTSASSSDGVHFVPHLGFQEADSVLVEGQRYYINENDVRAALTDLEIDGTTVELSLKPFEVIEITFVT